MPIVEPPVITPPPTRPDRADPSTFDDRADAWTIWERDNQVPEMGAAGAATYANAQEAVLRASQAVAARDAAVPAGAAAVAAAGQAVPAAATATTKAAEATAAATQVATMVAGATQIQMGGSTGYPTIGPSMINNFAHAQRLKRSLTFTRAREAMYLDQMGRTRTAAANVPVFEYSAAGRSLGYRSEPAITNVVPNPRFVGAATGLNAAMATGHGFVTGGATRTNNSTADFNGVPAFEVTLSANYTQSSGYYDFMLLNSASAAAGSTWTGSFFYQALTNDPNIVNTRIQVYALDSGGLQVGIMEASLFDASRFDWIRRKVTYPNLPANTAYLLLRLSFNMNPGTAATHRIRVGVPQLVAGNYEGSIVLPASGAIGAATKPADVLALPAAAADVLNPREGAFVGEFTLQATPTGAAIAFSFRNSNTGERIYIELGPGGISAAIVASGGIVAQVTLLNTPPQPGQRYRFALNYSAIRIQASLNGGAVLSANTSATPALSWDRVDIGNQNGAFQLNGHTAQFYPFPRVLADSELIAISRL